MDLEHKQQLRKRAIEEAKKFAAFVGYVWVVFSLLDIHKLFVLRMEHLDSRFGFKLGLNLINALVFGKILLIGDSLHLGEQLKFNTPMYQVLFRSAVFSVLLVCFEIIEEVGIGLLHGRTIVQSLPQWGGGGMEGQILAGVMGFVVLIPLFAFMELRRLIGEAEFHALMYPSRTKADEAKRGTRSNAA
jgi:hypothetical protein